MLENRRERAAALLFEFVLYAACCLIAYYYPATVTPFATEFDYLCDVIIGMTATSVLLIAVILLHIHIYNVRQLQIDELNRELAARNETLTRHNKMKSDFLATVSHEISKPLAVISASSADTIALLEELPAVPENMGEIYDNHERIEKRIQLLDGVISDLMDTAAIETGRLSLSRQLVKLSDFLKTVCDIQFKHFDKNGNRLTYDLSEDLPPIWLDPARIEPVMTNLISNAVRHTRGGEITVKLTRTEKGQTVSVADNGEGMDAAIAEVVMKQYAPSVKGDYWRHGIGLFLCRQIITSHGGEIWIDSVQGRGTTISFALAEDTDNE
jgi:signal transduction histidine kinase